MTSKPASIRPRGARADAQRNRDHILGTAERYFSEHGVTGSLDAIAKQAGVGSATLYRHFPNREALLAELLTARDDALLARQNDIAATSANAADALEQWLEAVVDWACAFDGLPEPLRAATTGGSSPLAVTCQGFITTTNQFLQAAQLEGSARREVRARDLFLLALATSWVRSAAMADELSATALTALARAGWQSADDSPQPPQFDQ